jgi:predicted DNA-binding transcriptional regulator AlpA
MPEPRRKPVVVAEPVVARPRRIVTKRRLREVKGIDFHRNHIDSLIKRGEFPRPDLWLGPQNAAWFEETIDAWIDQQAARAAARGGAA